MTPQEAHVFRMIESAAKAGRVCPTNNDIVEQIDARSTSQASAIVSRLERFGLIKIERGNCSRVATIVATGKRTRGEITAPHWRERVGHVASVYRKPVRAVHVEPIPEPIMLSPIRRDPCPRCGVRGDIGCAHGWVA